ncbi:uncharacterized protein [Procambarus clarkii]|uniref:uncharacterized protein isoform X1 n=2 Tax=Procambarus clarkii TaxID=6728 RepID=UPI0037438A4E
MEVYSYMCGECLQVYDTVDTFQKHGCHNDVEKVCGQEDKPTISSVEGEDDLSDHEETLDEEEDKDKGALKKKRRKYQAMDDTYRLNRTMRDKDFKLNRSHFYCFKDTLGDWDERSTRLLIQLIHSHPKTHFLLPIRTEKRMGHWERIHREMEAAGYTFTILQLRMRWREVLQKYRWTVDYNDRHEIKKRCEYFDEMNEFFGDWDKDATHSLLKQMHRIKLENQKNKIIRIGYSRWQKITENLNSEGHRFNINMVEGRWRNMVTMFKTIVDYNFIPNVEPRSMAYKRDLEELVKYVPQRRQYYEKKKGRSVKMERFPTNGSRSLLRAYKDCIGRFIAPTVDNRVVWDEIAQRMECDGFSFSTFKLKEILNGMIKGFENCQFHNSLPGAIRRDVPFYRDLAEIYGVHGRWPHTQISRTIEMRTKRKFRLRLQASQQLWSLDESRTLLQVYPDVLEAHVSQNLSHQTSDLWLQVAKAYAATGYPKRDVPEIAIHFGLLRQGYSQGNKFPLMSEMRRVKEIEEAVCYSPDVSKFTGDVEITYWNHEAVNHLLDLYLKYQPTASSSPGYKDEVFMKITEKMLEFGYGYNKDQVFEQFKTLLTQFNTRITKPWTSQPGSRKIRNPVATPPYWQKLHEVLELRKILSLSWTTGVKPLTLQAQKCVYSVACKKAEELLTKKMADTEHVRLLAEIIDGIRVHIRTHQLLNPVPRTRQVRFHLTDVLKNYDKTREKNKDIVYLHTLLEKYNMLKLFHDVSLGVNWQKKSPKRTLETDEGFPDKSYLDWISEEENSGTTNSQEEKDIAAEYLTFALTCLKENLNTHTCGNIEETNTMHINKKTNGSNLSNLKHSGITQNLECEVPITSEYGYKTSDNINVSELSKIHNVPHFSMLKKKVKERVSSKDYDVTMLSNSGSELDQSIPSCSYISPKAKIKCINTKKSKDVYKDLFGEVCNIIPKRCSVETKGTFYTFPRCSSSDLVIYLPKDLPLIGHSNISSINDSLIHQCSVLKQRKRKWNSDNDSLKSSGTEPDVSIDNLLNFKASESHHSEPQNINKKPETKIIQTRSGRKTRFTFFSKALNDNSDEETGEENYKKISENNILQKRPKLDPQTSESTTRRIKKTKLQTNKEPVTVLSYKVVLDGSAVVHSNASQEPIPTTSNEDKIFHCVPNVKNPVMSFFKEHEKERVKTEEKLLSMLNTQQVEQASVITEMLDTFKEFQCKLKDKR